MHPKTVIPQPAPSDAELHALLEAALQTAHPTDWETRLHMFLGDTDPFSLSGEELTRFADRVFFLVKQTGIKDPDSWIAAHRARFEDATKRKYGGLIDEALTSDGLLFQTFRDRGHYIGTLVKNRRQWLENHPGSCQPVEEALREIASRQSTAQSRLNPGAKPAGSSDQTSRGTQDHDDGLAVGGAPAGDRSSSDEPPAATSLATAPDENGTTKSEAVPVGPATSERTPPAAKITVQAQPDAKADRSAAAEPESPKTMDDITTQRKSAKRDAVAGSRLADAVSSPNAATKETKASQAQTNPTRELPDSEGACNGSHQRDLQKRHATGSPRLDSNPSAARRLKTQKKSAKTPRRGAKRSPEMMRAVLDRIDEHGSISRAAKELGIHRHAISYWRQRSKAGDDGYDVEWRGETWPFHEHLISAQEGPRDRVRATEYKLAIGYNEVLTHKGHVVYKTDQNGNPVTDENGNPVPETRRVVDPRTIRRVLERELPEIYGKQRKRKTKR